MRIFADPGAPYWVARYLGCSFTQHAQGLSMAGRGKLIVSTVVDGYTGEDCELYIVAPVRGWARKGYIKAVFGHVFGTLKCARCTVRVCATNDKALRLVERVGFVREGVLRQALQGKDILILGMLRGECRYYGQKEGR